MKIEDFCKPISKIEIGDYSLGQLQDGSIWIEDTKTGEGGQFSIKDLEPVMKKFYNKYF